MATLVLMLLTSESVLWIRLTVAPVLPRRASCCAGGKTRRTWREASVRHRLASGHAYLSVYGEARS
jgi:hypothetical protein